VPTRTTLLPLTLALSLAPWPALAQVQAPTPVDEAEPTAPERPPEPARPPARPAPGKPQPLSATARDPSPEPGPAPDPTAAGVPDTLPAPPPPPPPPPKERPAARAIEPVSVGYGDLLRHWADRRAAVREQDPARASSAAAALLDLKRLLAIENLTWLAASEVRMADQALAANLPGEALGHAEVATRLAPDFADAHLALARARLAKAPGEPWPALAALGDAVAAAVREPHTRRAFYGDLAAAALAALLGAAAATLALLLLKSLRLFLHDFHHLPLLRGSATAQAAFLGVVLLAVPLAFGLGPLLVLGTLLLAAWLYLSLAERLVATVAVLALAALPYAAEGVAAATTWTGTLAEEVYELEHGALDDGQVAALAAQVGEAPPPPVAAALGRHFKRRGDLAAALRWYGVAAKGDGRAAEVLVNVGNVRFLQGDLDGAKASYLQASDRAGGDLTVQAAAHYNLSKVYLRGSDIEKSSAARDRAEQEDGAFLRRHGADDDFSANRYLVDVPVPDAKVRALAEKDGTAAALGDAVRVRLGGPLPRGAWPWVPLGLLAFLWGLAAAARAIAPAHACERCGRPACRRCDIGGGPLCGQCVNVYVKKGVVDARDRLRKEAQVRRHRRLHQLTARALAVAGGGAGHVFHGQAGRGFAALAGLLFVGFLVWFWRGIMPPPSPSPYVLWGKVAVAAPLGLLVYLLVVRDVFRRTRS
jgi:tetratricopeptide (TPR) repeat protein